MKGRLQRLEQAAKANYVSIPQRDGPPKQFPPSAPLEAFLTNVRRLRGEVMPDHPLGTVAANSSDATWRESFVTGSPTIIRDAELKDLWE